jgi:hypothetical protein
MNFMEQYPYEASRCSASPYLLWNKNVHYHIYKSPQLDHILSHKNPEWMNEYINK